MLSVDAATSTGESTLSLGFTTPVLSCEVLSTRLSALATRAPKNISAATATEAAPKLYLRIEKRKTFSRCWRLILLSEFDLFSIVPPYVKTQNQIKSILHGYTSYSNAPMKPTMMSMFTHHSYYGSIIPFLIYLHKTKLFYCIEQGVYCLIIYKMLLYCTFK